MRYTIDGSYPAYVITGLDADGNVAHEDWSSDFASIMRGFVHRLTPGDTIHWVDSSAAIPAP